MRGRRLQIEWHEDEKTLYDRYRQEKDHQNRTRLQALWLLRRGHTMKEVASIVGVHYRTLQDWVGWYRQGGLEEVLRRRHGGHGGKRRRLTPQQEEMLKERARQGAFRTIWDAVHWVEQTFGVTYTYWGMRWVFDRLGLKKKVPRRVASRASAAEQEAWKKGAWLPS